MSRGPDYADDLTDSEQRTLEHLLRHAALAGSIVDAPVLPGPAPMPEPPAVRDISRRAPRTGPPDRRGWLAVTVSAAAVAAIALASGLLPLRPGPAPASPPTPPVTAASASTVDVLGELAAAARRAGPAPSASQTEVVVVTLRKSVTCTANAYEVSTTMKPGAGWPPVRLTIGQTVGPDGTWAWLQCSGPPARTGTPGRQLFDGATHSDGPEGWNALMASAREQVLLPDLLDPRALPDGVLVNKLGPDPRPLAATLAKVGGLRPGGTAGWWTAMTYLLSSPLCPAAVRSTALLLAVDRATDIHVITDHLTDILGRPGITLRVPYSVDGVPTWADLTFDRATGAVLQRVAYGPSGSYWSTAITAYQ